MRPSFSGIGLHVEKRAINPWNWQERFGFQQANEVVGAERVLYLAGQTSVDGEGQPLHEGSMERQALQAVDNMETVLRAADFELADVVRLTIFVVDVDAYREAAPAVGRRLGEAGARYASTLIGVTRLALPQLLVEIEGTAVK
jgi:enamine deaminase RidA (YjgF/YER057c/UK114 family)